MPEYADYAEVLRIYRKFSARPDEPLWVTFVMLGQEMERVQPDRCKACFRTHLEYSRLVDATCADPFHPTLAQHADHRATAAQGR